MSDVASVTEGAGLCEGSIALFSTFSTVIASAVVLKSKTILLGAFGLSLHFDLKELISTSLRKYGPGLCLEYYNTACSIS